MTQIEKAATQYAEQQNDCYTNDYNGFVNGVEWQDNQHGAALAQLIERWERRRQTLTEQIEDNWANDYRRGCLKAQLEFANTILTELKTEL